LVKSCGGWLKVIAISDAIELRTIDALVPYARNSRTHSEAQIEQLMQSMRAWGFTIPVLVDEAGGIIAGHGRVNAAGRLGMTEVPTIVAKGWTDAQKRAYVIADNQIPLNAGWDEELLASELGQLQEVGFDLDVIGFNSDALLQLLDPTSAPEPKVRARRRSRGGPAVELEGRALDAAVATALLALGHEVEPADFSPSARWVEGGPIIDLLRIDTKFREGDEAGAGRWLASAPGFLNEAGPTLLVAAMRAVVAMAKK
jgi:hypothetical protein